MLTTTAQNLAAMTDRAAFERLALDILRCADGACASVIRLGINAAGETIVSPLDGFACVAGDTRPLYIAVEATTTDVRALERKWLHGTKGDLSKAAKKAKELRRGCPTAEIRVYLITNQVVPAELRARVDKAARKLKVDCDVWEQSRLATYLDVDSTGQFLRSAYLGKSAERLSLELLLDIGRSSHREYASERRVAHDSTSWISRDSDVELVAYADDPTTRAILIVAESGFGKTVAANRLMAEWLRRGMPSLWVPAEVIETSASLHGALDVVLRDRVPTLADHCGGALARASGGRRLLVAIDDINTTNAPAAVLRKLLSWASSNADTILVCPVWPRFASSLDLTNRPEIRQQRIGAFAPSEAEAALAGFGDSELATQLGYDPLLIGLFRALAQSGATLSTNVSPRHVLQHFVQKQLDALQGGALGFIPQSDASEHRQAISRTAYASIVARRLNPPIELVRQWLNDDRLWAAMVEVLRGSGILWTTDRTWLAYRHDRVRDHLLADAMAELMRTDPLSSLVCDPFFAEVSAEALLRLGTPSTLVDQLGHAEPLILVMSLRAVDPRSEAESHIVRALQRWFAENPANGTRRHLMYRELSTIDSHAVLEATEDQPSDDSYLELARLRNGDARAGIDFCSSQLGDPRTTYLPRSDAIAAAQRSHGGAVNRNFQLLAGHCDTDRVRGGAIRLAGYIGHVDMIRQSGRLWREAENPGALLPDALWAQLTAPAGQEDFSILEDMLGCYLDSVEPTAPAYGTRARVHELLRMSGLKIHSSSIPWLMARASSYPELWWLVCTLLAQADVPEAVEAIARLLAPNEDGTKARGSVSMGALLIGNWPKSIATAAADRLQTMWQNASEADGVRSHAFQLWKAQAGQRPDDIQILRSIGPASLMYEQALVTRALLGDKAVESAFAALLLKTQLWARLGARVWGPALEAAVDHLLASESGTGLEHIADLLTLVPPREARKLLVRHWARLRDRPPFVQAALAVGGAELESLAEQAIFDWPKGEPAPLEFAILQLEMGHEDGLNAPVDEARLERLLKYRTFFSDLELRNLGEVARKYGLAEWGRRHIAPLLTNAQRAAVFPTEDDVTQELDSIIEDTANSWLRAIRWAETATERGDGMFDALDILDRWLTDKRTDEAMSLAAEIVVELRKRDGISILERHTDHANELQVQRLADVALIVRRGAM
jgi:hypothetical protein